MDLVPDNCEPSYKSWILPLRKRGQKIYGDNTTVSATGRNIEPSGVLTQRKKRKLNSGLATYLEALLGSCFGSALD